jgi:hypothetical protein
MVELVTTKADHVLALTVDGKIEASDIDRITRLIDEKLHAHDKLSLYADIDNFEGVSVEVFFTAKIW